MKKIYSIAFVFAGLFCTASTFAQTIKQIGEINHTDANGVADSLNKRYQVSGTVCSGNFTSSSKLLFYITDATGSIIVYCNQMYGYTPAVGDFVVVVGSLTQYGGAGDCGQLEIKPNTGVAGDTVYKVGTG